MPTKSSPSRLPACRPACHKVENTRFPGRRGGWNRKRPMDSPRSGAGALRCVCAADLSIYMHTRCVLFPLMQLSSVQFSPFPPQVRAPAPLPLLLVRPCRLFSPRLWSCRSSSFLLLVPPTPPSRPACVVNPTRGPEHTQRKKTTKRVCACVARVKRLSWLVVAGG